MKSSKIQTRAPVQVFPLIELPQELLDMIFSHLERTDILNLAKASRAFHYATESLIYKEIIFDWRSFPLERLLQILRTFSMRPDLANHVLRLELVVHDSPSKDSPLSEWNYELNNRELDYLRRPNGSWWPLGNCKLKDQHFDTVRYAIRTVRRAQIRHPGRWTRYLRKGNPYAYASLLLHHCHHLRHLDLDVAFHLYEDLPGLIVQHALSRPWDSAVSRFSRLSVVKYGTNGRVIQRTYGPLVRYRPGIDQEPPGDFLWREQEFESLPSCSRNLAGWFLLPGLQHLQIFTGPYQPTQEIFADFAGCKVVFEPNNLHAIRSLSINGTIMTTDCKLGQLLSQMRFLEDLQLVSAADLMNVWPNKEDILLGLDAVKSTLRKFGLEFVHGETPLRDNPYFPPQVLSTTPIPVKFKHSIRLPEGFFNEFSLISIRIPIHCLIDLDAERDRLVGPDFPVHHSETDMGYTDQIPDTPSLASLMEFDTRGTSELEKSLPLSIEEITLDGGTIKGTYWNHGGLEIIPTVFDFLTSSRGKFPFLRRICIIFHPFHRCYGRMRKYHRELQSLGQVLNVAVEFRSEAGRFVDVWDGSDYETSA